MELASKTAIVTGASRGLGKAVAIALVKKGATVYGLARDQQSLESLQEELGLNFIPVVLDITSENDVSEWITQNFSKEKFPDILINNAGAGYFEKIESLPSAQWHQMINTNLNAVFYLTTSIVPFMKSSKNSSHIINIGSILGKTSSPTKHAYSATKYALQGFSESLFKELREDNIKVSLVNPGSINTDFFKESGIESNNKMLDPADLAATIIHLLETPDNVLIDEITIRPLISL